MVQVVVGGTQHPTLSLHGSVNGSKFISQKSHVGDYVYMGSNNQTTHLMLDKTIFQLKCLHELLMEFSLHIPVNMLQSVV